MNMAKTHAALVNAPGARDRSGEFGHKRAMALKVLLVEDEEDTRDRLAAAIGGDAGLDLVSAAANLAAGVAALHMHQPDVLVTDIRLPDGLGYNLIRAARDASASITILVISVLGDENALVSAIEAGADGYLLKDTDEAKIPAAIREAHAGGSPISAMMARHLLKHLSNDASESPEVLTGQEQRVLSCIARGYTYREAAEQLGLSPNTIPSHIKNIYRKLQVHSRGEAVYEALRRGIIDKPS